jgi:N utilization substance protein A
VYVDDDNRQATVLVPDGELSLAIGKEGLNARLAHRLTGWRIDIVSEAEYYAAQEESSFADGEDDEFPGRCVAMTSSGKRCPNQALEGSRYCGVPAHRELAAKEEGAPAS